MRRTALILSFIFFCLPVCGQSLNYQLFENITLGRNAAVAGSFMQDDQGMIWIGTDKGLFSYDGYTSGQHFTFGERNNSRIYCGLTIGHILYLGSDNGLLMYDCHTDCYMEPETDFPTDVRALVRQRNKLWIGTLDGLFVYDLDSGKLRQFGRTDYPGLPHDTIYSMILASDDTLYIGTYNGFCSYSAASDTFTAIPLPSQAQKANHFVNSLLEDTRRDCIWIGTEGNLFRYTPGANRMERIDAFRENSVKTLALDRDLNLLAGTDNGLYVYRTDGTLQHTLHDSRSTLSLANNIIWSIFTDRDGNIWLGTDYGISLSRFNSDFQYVPISQITGTGEGNHFYSIFKDSRGNLWFGGTNGLIRFDGVYDRRREAVWYKMGSARYPLRHNRLRDIYEDRDGQLWIASDGSISRYDHPSEQFVHYNIVDSTGTHNSNWSYDMFEDGYGRLWIGTFLGGIFVVDKQKLIRSRTGYYVAEENYTTQNGLSGMFVNQLVPDHDGNVWVLLYNNGGINRIDIATREITKVDIGAIPGSESLNFLVCDSSGTVWAGFRGGVMCFAPGAEQPEVIPFGRFGSNEVLSMAEVEEDVWVSTPDGILTVDKSTHRVRRLGINNKVFTSLYYSADDGRVYMGTVDGYVSTYPRITAKDTQDLPVTVTALYVNNLPVSSGDGIKNIRHADRIELKHDQNNLSFEVSDLPYSLEEKSRFVYRLAPLDEDWNLLDQNGNRFAYNNLSYGTYSLTVSRLDADGKPSANNTTLEIEIVPPWYYTDWAKTLWILLALSLILWGINFFRVKNRLNFERMEKERILEQSQSKIDLFTNISHDLKTPLSMVIAPVSKLLLETKNPADRKTLEVVQRSAMKINSLIHQALDFNRIDSKVNSMLILSRVNLVSFALSLFEVFKETATKERPVEFRFETNVPELYVDIDVVKFDSILNNLLSNAFKHTPEGGVITMAIEARTTDGELDIRVSDTGTGIPSRDIPYIFQRFFQSSKTKGRMEGSGIGLYLVKTYSELHGGSIRVFSEEGAGTSFILTMPLQEKGADTILHESVDIERETELPLVLVVDDNREIAEFIRDGMQGKYRCRIADNGKTGFDLCRELLPDLIIADVMMPVMSGLEMCRLIRRNVPTSTIPIVLLTAKNDKETELESMHLNVDAFVAKPFEPEMLLSRIDQLMESKRQMEEKLRMGVLSTPGAIEAVSYDEKFLSNITRIIEDHIADSELNVNALCRLSGFNNKHIYRKTKQLTGMSPVEYIKSIRMKKAAMLLGQQKFTVAEVMYMVGFSSHSYFAKCYQAAFGKTPRQ